MLIIRIVEPKIKIAWKQTRIQTTSATLRRLRYIVLYGVIKWKCVDNANIQQLAEDRAESDEKR